jgi:uncharacterized membrane protein YphA (DoxX/SURF4 family)
MDKGLLTGILDWLAHPYHDESTTIMEWIAGLALVIGFAFLWAQVIRQIE